MKHKKKSNNKKTEIEIIQSLSSNIPECELDPGIEKIISILNLKGLPTDMSCAGHYKYSKNPSAWIQICPAHFKNYMSKYPSKMEEFLLAGEGRWSVKILYFGQNKFPRLGKPGVRVNSVKRVVKMEMTVEIVLLAPALDKNNNKTKEMKALERAAQKYL